MTAENVPADRSYTKNHEWVKVDGEVATVGITDHAQSELTDIVYVDLPSVGKALKAGASALVLESVKTVADVYAPGDGSVSEVNAALKKEPGLINRDPYGAGWIYRVKLSGPIAAGDLLDPAAYRKLIAGGP